MEIKEAILCVEAGIISFPLAHIIKGSANHSFHKYEHILKLDSIHGSFGCTPQLLSHLFYSRITQASIPDEIEDIAYSGKGLTPSNPRDEYQRSIWHLTVSNTNIRIDLYPEQMSSDSNPYMKLEVEGLGLDYEWVS